MFDALLDKARGLLGRKKPTATDAIAHNTYHADVFDAVCQQAPAIPELIEELNQDYDYTDDLIRDTFMQFWLSGPQLRATEEMDPSRLRNHAVAAALLEVPENQATRAKTHHDDYLAALTVLSVADTLRERLDENDDLGEKEDKAEEQEQAAEQAQDALSQAAQDAQDAQDALDNALGPNGPGQSVPGPQGEPGGGGTVEGPMTQGQSAAQQALEQAGTTLEAALAVAEQAVADAEAAGAEAAVAARDVRDNLLGPLQEAIQRALEQVAEEEELFAAWGYGPGELQKMSFEERATLAALLRGNRMSKFRKMIGRYRFEQAAKKMKKVEHARSEIIGTELSNDLSRILPSELASLTSPVVPLRLRALSRLASGSMLSFKFGGKERVGRGAMIVCVDNSSSMLATDSTNLTREAWAKACALALLDGARQSGRDFVGINFSSRTQLSVYRFPKGTNDLTTALAFCEEFFSGGTDFATPLKAATDILEAEFNDEGKSKGDIVFITDDECAVTPEWMTAYLERKERLNFRVFGIAAGVPINPNGFLEAVSDQVRTVVEFAEPDCIGDIMSIV